MSPPGQTTGSASLEAHSGPPTVNTLTPPIPTIYLRLRFVDPTADNAIRDFPPDFPVSVVYGVEINPNGTETVVRKVAADGALTFPAWTTTKCRSVTLHFIWANETGYISCEPAGSPPNPPQTKYVAVPSSATDPPMFAVPAASSPPADQRFFSLPGNWFLRQADWHGNGGGSGAPTGDPVFTGSGSYDKATGRISQTQTPEADIGSAASPIVFILDPHWKFFRFQFFDRYYGDAQLQSPPFSNAHKRRISIPQVCLEGYRADANAAGATPDTISNWTIGADPKDAIQCISWILARDNSGTALPAMTGANTGLRMRTHQTKRTFVYSKSETDRSLRHMDASVKADADDLKPSANRLRFYDLPRIWKSRKYYTRGLPGSPPPNDGKYFDALTEADLNTANVRTTPLAFCLDDLVLADNTLTQVSLAANERVVLFHHKFRNQTVASPPQPVQTGVTISNEGVYKPGGVTDSVTDQQGYPFSDVTIPVRYYVSDYPDWTRLVIAQGNFWDIFEDRTPDVVANQVVGARAAVRWIDATAMPYGKAPTGIAGSDGRVSPRPAVQIKPFFALQPYYWQRYLGGYNAGNPEVGPRKHIEWTTRYGTEQDQIGRLDIALLRCADWDGDDEVAVMMRLNKLIFDYTTAVNPLNAANNATRMAWVNRVVTSSLARWNGHDAYNNARACVLPLTASPPPSPPASPPKLKINIVTFFQYVKGAWAHFNVTVIDVTGTSSMGEVVGSGKLRVNCDVHDAGPTTNNDAWGAALSNRGLAAAHELGHCGSLPDEYGNSDRYTDKCLLACPYIFEAPPVRGLMNYNWYIRARYFWHAAEWMRLLPDFRNTSFKVTHFNPLAPGANPENNFALPHYPHFDASPPVYQSRNFVCWPVSFNLRSRNVGDATYYDSILYMVGEDKYSTEVLPNKLGGGAKVDGILLILVRFFLDLSGIPGNAAFKTKLQNELLAGVRQSFDTRLNARRTANFQLMDGTRRDPQFSRCLLEFVPAFTATVATANASPAHIALSFQTYASGGVAPALEASWTVNAPASANSIRFNLPDNLHTVADPVRNTKVTALAGNIFQRCCVNLGVSHLNAPAINSFQTPASYVNIVKTVMHNAAPDPTIG